MINKAAFIIATSIFLTGLVCDPATAGSTHRHRGSAVYYLSLGTSLAAGVQADPATGENIITDVSYPSRLADIIGEDVRRLRHKNLGCPGETSETFISGGLCDYPRGSQFDQALRFLKRRAEKTGLITIDLGANDVLQCINGTAIDFDCLAATLDRLTANLAFVLTTLREAAPGVPIVGMNYYNPLLAFWFDDPVGATLTVGLQLQINTLLEAVYAAHGVPVADVADAFMSYDLATDANANSVPDSVELLCQWTWMCSNQNIHANDTGYAVIAEEFFEVLPEIRTCARPWRHHDHRRHDNWKKCLPGQHHSDAPPPVQADATGN